MINRDLNCSRNSREQDNTLDMLYFEYEQLPFPVVAG